MTDDEQKIADAVARAFETLSERLSRELSDAFTELAQQIGRVQKQQLEIVDLVGRHRKVKLVARHRRVALEVGNPVAINDHATQGRVGSHVTGATGAAGEKKEGGQAEEGSAHESPNGRVESRAGFRLARWG